jgi:hypothetical protein
MLAAKFINKLAPKRVTRTPCRVFMTPCGLRAGPAPLPSRGQLLDRRTRRKSPHEMTRCSIQ